MVIVTLLLALWATNGQMAFALSPVAIHATQEEVKIWRQRSTQGPYLDDWQRIQNRAQAFRNNPSADFWPGNQIDKAWDAKKVDTKQQPPNFHPGRRRGDGLRDAGFVYLVTGEPSYRDAVHRALLTQATMPGTDFGNTTKWDQKTSGLDYDNFEIVNWLRKLAYGYSYIRASLSPTDRETIDRWFHVAATYWHTVLRAPIDNRFPQRYQDNYSTPQAPHNPGNAKGQTHWGGYTVYKFQQAWFNIPATCNAMVAVVGVLLDDQTLKEHAKRFVKEWLMFAVAKDGTIADQFRWNDAGNPQTGYGYAGTALGSIITAVDHLARAGDTELYNYETSFGHYGWEGGPKSLRLVMQRYARLALGGHYMGESALAYASKEAVLTPDKLIGPGITHIQELSLIPASLYYKDATIKKAYSRPLPKKPQAGGYDAFGGDWGTYPGLRLMFGDLEGVVWPYPGKQPLPTSSSSPPTHLVPLSDKR